MIKEEWTSTNEIDGKPLTQANYSLSREERDHLNEILKNYEKKNVEEFVQRIEMRLSMSLQIFHYFTPKSHAEQTKRLNDIIKDIEAVSNYLLLIQAGRIKPIPPRQCDFLVEWTLEEQRNPKSARGAINLRAWSNAGIAHEALQALTENLKSAIQTEKLKRGRPRTDELGLAFAIAKEFKKFIGIPRPHTGPFTEICEYCFEILGDKGSTGNDRTRAIRQALKKLSSSCPARAI